MPTSSYKTFLMHGTQSTTPTWSKLIDIKDYPDLGTDPELLETTTLSDGMKTFILGIQGNEGLTFTANYVKADYEALKALEGKTEHYAVWLGATVSGGVATPTGSEGKFTFDGQLAVHLTGKSVNEVREMSITIAPSTVIVES